MKNLKRVLIVALGLFCTTALFAHHPKAVKKVVIDVGHGGDDTGQNVDGLLEKDVVLAIAQKLVELNTRKDLEIVLLRNNDQTLSLKDRVELVNAMSPDLALSLHANGSPDTTKTGVEAYVFAQSEFIDASREIAQRLVNAVSHEKQSNRGVKMARFYVLQNFDCPTLLLEVGFLTNAQNRAVLMSDEGQTEVAQRILSVL